MVDLLLGAAPTLLFLGYALVYKVVQACRITRPFRAWRKAEAKRIDADIARISAEYEADQVRQRETMIEAWTPEQVEAFRAAWEAAVPDGNPAKGRIIRIQHG
jgi:hypothetical protein